MTKLKLYYKEYDEIRELYGEAETLLQYAKGLVVEGESYEWVIEEVTHVITFKGDDFDLVIRAKGDTVSIWISSDEGQNEKLLTYVNSWGEAKAWVAGWLEAMEMFV